MNLLIISDYLELSESQAKRYQKDNNFVMIMKWKESDFPRRLDDFHVLIIDISYQDDAQLRYLQEIYKKLIDETEDFLNAQKVIIFICDAKEICPIDISKENEEENIVYCYKVIRNLFDGISINANKPPGYEFRVRSNTFESLEKYFSFVTKYTATLSFDDMEYLKKNKNSEIAWTESSNHIIAAELNLNKGIIVILPGYDRKYTKKVLPVLVSISNNYNDKEKRKKYNPTSPPDWINEFKLDEHKRIADEIIKLEEKKEKYDKIIALLYDSDKALEVSVVQTLQDIGIQASLTEKSYTVDILAEYNKKYKFAIEVTGLNDKIKKRNHKLGQLWDYEPFKRENEKLILLANTYNHLPFSERIDKENLTDDPKIRLQKLNAVFLTSAQLYILWKAVKENKITVDDVVKLLYDTTGELIFNEGFQL